MRWLERNPVVSIAEPANLAWSRRRGSEPAAHHDRWLAMNAALFRSHASRTRAVAGYDVGR
jgi:hypothetical protein